MSVSDLMLKIGPVKGYIISMTNSNPGPLHQLTFMIFWNKWFLQKSLMRKLLETATTQPEKYNQIILLLMN